MRVGISNFVPLAREDCDRVWRFPNSGTTACGEDGGTVDEREDNTSG